MAKDPLPLRAVTFGIKMLKTVRTNNAWRPDTFEILFIALEERSLPVQSAEVLRALEYQQLALIMANYLIAEPDIKKRISLATRIGWDLLELTKNRPNADTGDYERVSSILRSCQNKLRDLSRG